MVPGGVLVGGQCVDLQAQVVAGGYHLGRDVLPSQGHGARADGDGLGQEAVRRPGGEAVADVGAGDQGRQLMELPHDRVDERPDPYPLLGPAGADDSQHGPLDAGRLHLHAEEAPPPGDDQHLLQGGDPLLRESGAVAGAHPQRPHLGQREVAHPAAAVGGAVDLAVVHDDGDAVGGAVDIDLHALEWVLKGSEHRRQGVLGGLSPVPAVGNDQWTVRRAAHGGGQSHVWGFAHGTFGQDSRRNPKEQRVAAVGALDYYSWRCGRTDRATDAHRPAYRQAGRHRLPQTARRT